MLNQNTINTEILNKGNIPLSISQDDYVVNGFSISNENIRTYAFDDTPQVNLATTSRPQSDGSIFLSNFKESRNIRIGVYIKGESVEDFTQKVDELRKNIFKKNIFFDQKVNGEIRRIKVNCVSSPKILRHFNITFMKVEITFRSIDPYWYLLENQTTSISNVTINNPKEEITTLGSSGADVNAYIFFQITGTTQLKMKIGENEIIIDYTFLNGDILQIDGEEKKVLVNSIEVSYSGVFPILEVGTNFVEFNTTGTFQANILILNKINYV